MMELFGRRYAYDERDDRYPARRVLAVMDDERRSQPWKRGPIMRQRGGTCVGHGGRAWYEAAPKMHKPGQGPDPYQFYREAIVIDEWTSNDNEVNVTNYDDYEFGTSIRAMCKVLQDHRFLGAYVWAHTAEEVADFLTRRAGGPVIMGTNWYDTMSRPAGRLAMARVGGPIVGGHAYLARGYNKRRGIFLFQNSWGSSWGDRGEFRLTGEDLGRLLSEDGDAACGVETLPW